ncbi:MAG: anti-sigma F factor [Clostridia bacterium]|nr:anti-sigma F factor [Clostridia bacterium]
MNENYIKIESKSRLENIATIRVAITSFLSTLNIHFDELMDIKTALSEAVTNAIDHAYEEEQDEKIIVEAYIYDYEKIKIKIVDFGKGIEDISLAMTPAYTSKPESEHAGMGFTIMESFMDEVIIDSKINEGTTITLTKIIRKKKSIVS